jgi:hypothetical protein
MITNDTLRSLAQLNNRLYVSVYMPTHVAGRDTREDPIRLRNLLDEAEGLADARDNLRTDDVRRLLEPARDLLDNDLFWRRQSNGLAVILGDGQILGEDRMKLMKLATAPEPLVTLNDRVTIRPLVPEATSSGKFHVLALSMGRVVLLECFADSYRELDLHDIPESIEDAVGYDYEQRSLQFHTGAASQGGARPAVFHGQGGGGEDRDELASFIERVANGVDKLLAGEQRTPLVLAGVDELVSKFRIASDHPNIAEQTLTGGIHHAKLDDLHREALGALGSDFDEPRRVAIERVKQAVAKDQGSVQLEALLTAASDARVQTLLADCREPVWGAVNGDPGAVNIHENRQPDDDDLVDLVISKALNSGAEVHAAARGEVTAESPVAGELRF